MQNQEVWTPVTHLRGLGFLHRSHCVEGSARAAGYSCSSSGPGNAKFNMAQHCVKTVTTRFPSFLWVTTSSTP